MASKYFYKYWKSQEFQLSNQYFSGIVAKIIDNWTNIIFFSFPTCHLYMLIIRETSRAIFFHTTLYFALFKFEFCWWNVFNGINVEYH